MPLPLRCNLTNHHTHPLMSKKLTGAEKEVRRRLRRRFRFSVTDENKFSRILNLRLTAPGVILMAVIAAIALAIAGTFIVVNTPMRVLLPGYLRNAQRQQYEQTAMRIDSIASETAMRNKYVDNLVAILNSDLDTVLPPIPTDTVSRIYSIDSLAAASQAEIDFINKYKEREKFNLSVMSPIVAQGMKFINPLDGAELRQPEKNEDPRHATFDPLAVQPVSSIYRGTVLDVFNTPADGIVVIVQHPNEFVSRYSGITAPFVSRGDKISSGRRLGLVERDKAADITRPSFELWYNGTQVSPGDYIPF